MSSIFLNTSSSSSSTTSSSSTLRVPGLASGLDTDSIVKSMVSNYQTKIDKVNQAKQTLQWQQEAYRDIIKDIKGLQDYFDPLSSKYILSSNSFNTNSVTNADTSKVSASASSGAKPGTYTVNVQQLAEQAKISGSPLNSMISVLDANPSKWSGATLTLTGIDPIILDSITDGNSNGTTLDEVVANINKKIAATDLKGKVSASYVKEGNNSYIKFTNTGTEDIELTAKDCDGNALGSISSINSGISTSTKLSDLNITSDMSFDLSYDSETTTKPITITATSTDTLQSLMEKVNSATSGTITMSIDDTTGKISFQSKSYGSNSSIAVTNDVSGIMNKFRITDPNDVGEDAIVDITAPGQAKVTTTQSSNKFTTNGVTYNLVSTGTTTTTVTENSDAIVDNMKKFIEDYNSVISKINTKLTEKKDSDYPPLTDAQKESMSEDQITAWEAKAKVGILRNDDYLGTLMAQLRGIFSSPVYSNYSSSDTNSGKVSLSFGTYGTNSIGIDTSTDYTDGGKLVLKDEDKLKSAIENNLDDFKKLFIGASDKTLGTNESYVGSTKYKEDGIFERMDTILRDYVAAPGLGEDGTYTLAGTMNIFVNKQYDYNTTGYGGGKNTLPDQIYNKTSSISKIKTQMSDAETRYYAQFTALETALSNLNSQQSVLSSMLGTS